MKLLFKFTQFIIKYILIKLLQIYKNAISPFLPHACRYQPTCSEYMKQAIEIHGIVKGVYLGLKRLLRCHPFGGSGYDPVPQKKQNFSCHKDTD